MQNRRIGYNHNYIENTKHYYNKDDLISEGLRYTHQVKDSVLEMCYFSLT